MITPQLIQEEKQENEQLFYEIIDLIKEKDEHEQVKDLVDLKRNLSVVRDLIRRTK